MTNCVGEAMANWLDRRARITPRVTATPNPVFLAAEDRQPEPARKLHPPEIRIGKGVCPDCKEWVRNDRDRRWNVHAAAEVEIGEVDKTAVYRLYDAGGQLLYVGMTVNLQHRFAAHAKEKCWWSLVVKKPPSCMTSGRLGGCRNRGDPQRVACS